MEEYGQNNDIKFLILSDSHLGIQYSNKSKSTLKFALGNCYFHQMEEIIKLAINYHKVDFVIHCGDFFNRSKPPPSIIARATSLLLQVAEYTPVYIVPGNHERGKLPIGLLHYHKNIHIFTKPCSFIFQKGNHVIKLTGFPYVRKKIKLKFSTLVNDAWNTVVNPISDKPTYTILVLHQLIQGSRIEHFVFSYGDNVIPYSQVPSRFNLIAVGHVHRFQFLSKELGSIKSFHDETSVSQDLKTKSWKFETSLNKVNRSPLVCYPGSC